MLASPGNFLDDPVFKDILLRQFTVILNFEKPCPGMCVNSWMYQIGQFPPNGTIMNLNCLVISHLKKIISLKYYGVILFSGKNLDGNWDLVSEEATVLTL